MASTLSIFFQLGQTLPLLLLLIQFTPGQACTCAAPPEPGYCRADLVALVQIIEKQRNEVQDSIRYRFRTLQVLTDPHNLTSSSSRVRHLHTGGSSAMCGVDLTRNGRYLIGASRVGSRLQLSLCRSYVRPYEANEQVESNEWRAMRQRCAVTKKRRKPKTEDDFESSTEEKGEF